MTSAIRSPEPQSHSGTEATRLAGVAARGTLWLVVTMLLTRVSGFLVSVVLARLVAPDQFGLLGMANVALAAIAMVGELGLGAALVQRRGGRDLDTAASTAFWTNALFGAVLVAVNAAGAPLVAWYFRNPAVTPILCVMGLQFGTNALGAVHHALLSRELDYRRKLLPDALPGMVNGAVAIWGALHGWGVWGLVAGAQIGAVAGVIAVWQVCRWRPAWTWDRKLAGALLGYGKHVIGTELLRFLTQNVDYLIVGRIFGVTALGVYMLAFNLANLVLSNAGFLLARLAFPLFARLQDDPPRLRTAYLRLVGYLTLLSLPAMVGLCLLAHEFVAVVYGERWHAAVVPLQVMTVLGAVRALATLSAPLMCALGRPDTLTRLGLLAAPLTAVATLAGAAFGLAGVAVGETLATLVTGVLLVRAGLDLLGVSPRHLWARLAPTVRSCGALALGILVVSGTLARVGAPPSVQLTAGTAVGVVVFWYSLGAGRAGLLREARQLMRCAVGD